MSVWFISLRSINEKELLSKVDIWFTSLRSVNEKSSLMRG